MAWEHLNTSALMKNRRIYEYALKWKLQMSPYTPLIPMLPLSLTTLVTLCYYQWYRMLFKKKKKEAGGQIGEISPYVCETD